MVWVYWPVKPAEFSRELSPIGVLQNKLGNRTLSKAPVNLEILCFYLASVLAFEPPRFLHQIKQDFKAHQIKYFPKHVAIYRDRIIQRKGYATLQT